MGDLVNFEPDRNSHLAHLSYDPDSRHLHVRFKPKNRKKDEDERTYTFSGVPHHVFAAMTRHPSTGEYFHRVIKRHYKQER